MILVDTDVLSELMRPRQDPNVLAWTDRHTDEIGIPAQVLSELVYGIERVQSRDRQMTLRNGLALLLIRIGDRVVPFDREAAESYGWLRAKLESEGRPGAILDSQIAALAITRQVAVATRNTRHFERMGVLAIDPWVTWEAGSSAV